jgi:hypothetical protein
VAADSVITRRWSVQELISQFSDQMEVVKAHFKGRKKGQLLPHQQLIMDDLRHNAEQMQVIEWPKEVGKTIGE